MQGKTPQGIPTDAALREQFSWGRYPRVSGYELRIQDARRAAGLLAAAPRPETVARGAARSYGDAAVNEGRLTLDLTGLDRFLAFDERAGLLHVEAGVTLAEILEVFVPRGWFLPVTPGTRFPTIGGSVASDVHGKNHHVDGTISGHVERLHMMLAGGEIVTCSREEKPDLFWATAGGMGLTGLILSVELRLQPIESAYINYEGVRARDLDEIFRLFEESQSYPFSVAWIDCLTGGAALGRSIIMRGSHAKMSDIGDTFMRRNPLALQPKRKLAVPLEFPTWSLNQFSVKAFNTLYFHKHPRRLKTLTDYDSFFYPLDSILHWNRIYGRKGMLQYQCVIPQAQGYRGIRRLIEEISASGRGSFLAVLKQFGPQNEGGPLIFPEPGYTLALDFPVGNGSVFALMDRWDKIVLDHGGKLYLTKDARMRRDLFTEMYPRLDEWREAKARYDADNVFQSNLSRRLGLTP